MPKTNVKEYKGILSGRIYRIGDRIGKGGEGTVYRIANDPKQVAKIYNGKKSPEEMQNLFEKLKVMVDMRIRPYRENDILIAAWPQDVLLDGSGKFVGYVMPFAKKQRSLVVACRPSERSSMLYGPDYTWRKSIATAYNLALMVDSMHSLNVVIGDMNANNILIDAQCGVTLIDCDSFQVSCPKTGKLYKCTVGLPETFPAEIQGRDMRKPGNDFSYYTDRFALAVHIFSLLCNGFHPFNVVKPVTRGASVSGSASIQVKNIVRGYCPYVMQGNNRSLLPMEAPDMEMLPDYIRELFRRAFGYDASTAVLQSTLQNRPTAQEWCDALRRLFDETMTVCSKHKEHVYRAAYGKCPWCEMESKTRQPKQPNPVVTSIQNNSQKAYQKLAPAKAAAAAQRKANITTPKGWTYTPGTYRRDAKALYLLCIVVGMVITSLPLQTELNIIYQAFGYSISPVLLTILNVIFGAIGGFVVASLSSESYLRAVNAWPWLWMSLLSPLAAWAGMLIVALAIMLIVLVVYLIIGFIGLMIFLAILAGS